MGALVEVLKGLKLWQVAALVSVLAVAAVGTYAVAVGAASPSGTALGEGEQLIPVQRGDLVNQVSTSGNVLFPNKETLAFSTQGEVAGVLVQEGDTVEEGQVLATLDAATIASLEKAVAQSRLTLRDAEDALTKARSPHTPLDLARAQARVASAEVTLQNALETLDKTKAGPSADDLMKAQTGVETALATLENARDDLRLAQRDGAEKIDSALDDLATAREGYREAFETWLGITPTDAQMESDPETLLATWGVDLEQLFGRRFTDISRSFLASGPPKDDPATPWSETVIYGWTNLYPAPLLPTCSDDDPSLQDICIEKELTEAWDSFQNARDALDLTEVQVAKAIASATTAVTRAEDALVDAEDTLVEMRAGPDPLDIRVKEGQLAVAQADLADAQESLDKLQNSPDPLTIALREADVASASLAVQKALERLEGATLRAAVAGIVSAVNIEPGQNAGQNATIEIIDPSTVEVNGAVDEIDVLFVRTGMPATVSLDALSGQVLQGTVSSVSTSSQAQQGVVTFPVRIRVQVPQGVQLREGLSATAGIIIRQETNVLLIPQQAVRGTFQQPMVRVMVNGRLQEQSVTLGNSDDFWVVVQDGLREGDQVVMASTQVSTGGFGGFGSGGVPGGGGFGRGAGFGGGAGRTFP